MTQYTMKNLEASRAYLPLSLRYALSFHFSLSDAERYYPGMVNTMQSSLYNALIRHSGIMPILLVWQRR